MESMGVVVRRYIDFLILLIPTPLVHLFFFAAALYILKNVFLFFIYRPCGVVLRAIFVGSCVFLELKLPASHNR